MTDIAFVLGAYVVVLGGIAGYAVALARRVASAHRLAESIQRERDRGDEAAPATSERLVARGPFEAGR